MISKCFYSRNQTFAIATIAGIFVTKSDGATRVLVKPLPVYEIQMDQLAFRIGIHTHMPACLPSGLKMRCLLPFGADRFMVVVASLFQHLTGRMVISHECIELRQFSLGNLKLTRSKDEKVCR